MQLSIDSGAGLMIQDYSAGKIRINGNDYLCSLILTPQQVISNWRPQHFADLIVADFTPIIDLQPDVILWGIGAEMVFPDHKLLSEVHAARIGIEVMTTAAACRTYNLLMSDGRKVVAALML